MVKWSVRVRLHDILKAIEGIQETVAGLDFETYRSTWHIRHLPADLKIAHPQVVS